MSSSCSPVPCCARLSASLLFVLSLGASAEEPASALEKAINKGDADAFRASIAAALRGELGNGTFDEATATVAASLKELETMRAGKQP